MAVALALGSLLKGTKIAQAGIGLNLVKNQAEEIRALTLREYGYDFVGLATKLIIYFAVMLIFAKFMEAVILSRGFVKLVAGVIGYNIPSSTEFPKFLTDLFSEQGLKGFKFWDFVKIGAILMVLFEFIKYTKQNPNNKSALTIGVFVGIIAILGLTTIPELLKRVKTTDFDLESLR